MDNFDDYKKFFELRDKYPNLANLISELLAAFFLNKGHFPKQFYIYGSYSVEDVNTILKEFGITQDISALLLNLRNSPRTLITIIK